MGTSPPASSTHASKIWVSEQNNSMLCRHLFTLSLWLHNTPCSTNLYCPNQCHCFLCTCIIVSDGHRSWFSRWRCPRPLAPWRSYTCPRSASRSWWSTLLPPRRTARWCPGAKKVSEWDLTNVDKAKKVFLVIMLLPNKSPYPCPRRQRGGTNRRTECSWPWSENFLITTV